MTAKATQRLQFACLLGIISICAYLLSQFGTGSFDSMRFSPIEAVQSNAKVNLGQVSQAAKILNAKTLEAARGQRIVARVFYGRRALVEILEVYIRRNLKVNGGILDQVEFAWQEGSTQAEDIDYLDRLVAAEPSYVGLKTEIAGSKGYSARFADIEDDIIYVKIDDDTMFVDDRACASLVLALLEHPEYAVVSANVIRHPLLSHVHARKGALYPYSFVQDDGIQNTAAWRPSEIAAGQIAKGQDIEDFKKTQIPVQKYSYLPVREQLQNLAGTPASQVEYGGPGTCSWASPYCSVQMHMSFFSSLEDGQLEKYDFGVWDMHLLYNERYSVNFIAWRGRYVFEGLADGIIPEDDEDWLTVKQVAHTGNHHFAIGTALISHLAYGQPGGFAKPDYSIIVQKYKSLAQEIALLPMREWKEKDWRS